MNPIPVLDRSAWLDVLDGTRRPWHDAYYAMYSSLWGGVVTDPALMLVPADDHVVHRGDGVFETIKCTGGAVYALARHLARLEASATRIGLRSRWGEHDLADLVLQTLRAGRRPDALVRVLMSRGPGSYGVNPHDCPEPQLYITAYRLSPPFMRLHPEGARAVTVDVPLKPGFLATVKTCNYLPNALMKKAAEEAGAHFPLAYDERGFLAEGATENLGIVSPEGALRLPRADRILDGITVQRVRALAPAAVAAGLLRGVEVGDVPRASVESAAELLVFGTTPDVTAVVNLDGRPVGAGVPGPAQAFLNRLLEDDIRGNASMRTEVDLGGG